MTQVTFPEEKAPGKILWNHIYPGSYFTTDDRILRFKTTSAQYLVLTERKDFGVVNGELEFRGLKNVRIVKEINVFF